MKRVKNTLVYAGFTALLGGFAGAVIWVFLKASGICAELIRDTLPQVTGAPYITFILCVSCGFVTGTLHRYFGDYPEELDVVMGKIRKDRHYDYHPMFVMLVCAFLPLICGASIGPEAGLTGVIAALCYWIGDNVTFAGKSTELFSQIGEAVTLGQLFHSPLFGILAVEEGDDSGTEVVTERISKGNKLLFYGISAVSGFLTAELLNLLFGSAMAGFPSFSEVMTTKEDIISLLIYIPAGLLLYAIFELSERVTHLFADRIPVILKETICGAVTGIMVMSLPMVMYSGEEEMGELMETFVNYSPYFLLGICLLKVIMTTFCINFGLKGGHFFPLIFACACMGFAIASLVFPGDPVPHSAFAAATVTGTVLGAQLKKPLAVTLLLLLCFPAGALLWIFLCAAIGKSISSKNPEL